MRVRHQSPTRGEDEDPLRHNCSGKHAGFLVVSRHLGEPLETYLEPASGVQRLVREAVSKACEASSGELATAVDGCSAPTFALPLVTFARGMKNLARARSGDPELARALARVRDAMRKAPELVSGEGRLDYDLARSFPNNVVNKSGAEAIIGIGFSDPPLGIVVKVHDGADRALGAITLAVLRELRIVDDLARFPLLARHERPAVTNHARLRTGEIVATVTLARESA
jgi:L-asparaginase II